MRATGEFEENVFAFSCGFHLGKCAIAFQHGHKTHRFGIQVSEQDAKAIIERLQHSCHPYQFVRIHTGSTPSSLVHVLKPSVFTFLGKKKRDINFERPFWRRTVICWGAIFLGEQVYRLLADFGDFSNL